MSEPANQLLIIEDSLADYATYVRLLASEKQIFSKIHHTDNLDDASNFIDNNTPQCCILDYSFPGGSAKDFIRDLRRRKDGKNFPIVVSTGQGDERVAVELMQMGVQDYLVKDDLTASELGRALKNAMRTFSLQTQLHKMAHFDSLTGLLNRSLFLNRLEQAVNEAKRYNRTLSLICLDVDHFKQINDTYGHDVGDIVLRVVADRIKSCVRDSDSVSRFGGDEFMVLLPNAASHEGHFVAQKLLKEIPTPVRLNEFILYIYPSIGLANFPDTATNHQELLKQADAALYKAKEQGRSQYVKFSKTYRNQWQKRNLLAKELPKALEDDLLEIAYLPTFTIPNMEFVSVESLVRWQFAGEDIPANDIIDLINNGSLSIPFHQWLFDKSLAQLKEWKQQNPDLKLSFNMPLNLCHNQLMVEYLMGVIEKYRIPAGDLIMEIDEPQLMKQPDLSQKALLELHKHGLKVAIDNFGSGYSSMQYLVNLPLSQLKIDQHFFLQWDENPNNQKVVEAITTLGHQIGLEIVAEGIENQHLCDIATDIGCDAGQGFGLGTPQKGNVSWTTFVEKSLSLN